MNLDTLKGRIAEALVEAMFHQAGYRVARIGRESHAGPLVKAGADEFMPDFLVWKPTDGGLHRLLAVEVKYRSNLPEFLRRHGFPHALACHFQSPSALPCEQGAAAAETWRSGPPKTGEHYS